MTAFRKLHWTAAILLAVAAVTFVLGIATAISGADLILAPSAWLLAGAVAAFVSAAITLTRKNQR